MKRQVVDYCAVLTGIALVVFSGCTVDSSSDEIADTDVSADTDADADADSDSDSDSDGYSDSDSDSDSDADSDADTDSDSDTDGDSDVISGLTICGRPDSCQMPGSRDTAYWPYDVCSPWNHPIGDGAVYEEISFQPTSAAWNQYIGWASSPSWNDFGCLGPRTDNQVVVEDVLPSYAATIGGSGQEYSFNVPNDFEVPPASDDGHIYFVKADRSEAYETYLSSWNGSNIQAQWLVKNYSLTDSGNMPQGDVWTYRGTRAYGGSAMAGLIRKGELTDGIHHAVTLKAPQNALNKNGPNGHCWTWPASACDGEYSNYADSGNLYMGSLVAIPPDADLSFITNPKIMNLAIALRDYGGYVTDRGSDVNYGGFPSCWQYMTEYQSPEMMDIDEEYEQLGRIAGLLQVVVNNSSDNIGGGGTPRTCFAPTL